VEDGVTTLDGDTVAMLRTQTQRLARLAEDVSAVSRAEEHQLALSPRPQSPVRLLEDAASTAGSGFADKGVELHVDAPPGLPTVDADADRIGQVLANLLGNALRHTPTGGSVTLAARAAQGGVELVVRDTGEGIPAQHVPHVFERFYRADSARDRDRGGSGIGLAITKALVEAHGGHVTARSAGPGRGSEFVVWLPVRG
jgi:signal transduction histidine kinase